MFKTTNGTGFQIQFPNEWTVSVQWGRGTCSDNHDKWPMDVAPLTSKTAEIAAWDKDGNWYQFNEYEQVKGRCSPDEVTDFINIISSK